MSSAHQCRESPDILIEQELQVVSAQVSQTADERQQQTQHQWPGVVWRPDYPDLNDTQQHVKH